jgi:hypothetical protein
MAARFERTHGESDHNGKSATPEFRAWSRMIGRCTCKSNKDYHRYGGRGIRVCDRWINSYENFLADMGRKPTLGHSLDRADNNKGYEPGNCRWATQREQCNNRRSNRLITHNGETHSITEWSRRTGLDRSCISGRINQGWPVDKALTIPSSGTPQQRAVRGLSQVEHRVGAHAWRP